MKSFEERLKEKANQRRQLQKTIVAGRTEKSPSSQGEQLRSTGAKRTAISTSKTTSTSTPNHKTASNQGASKVSKGKSSQNQNPSGRKLKVVGLVTLFLFTMVIGAMIGYGVLGKKPAFEIFNIQTWKHMFDLIFAPGK